MAEPNFDTSDINSEGGPDTRPKTPEEFQQQMVQSAGLGKGTTFKDAMSTVMQLDPNTTYADQFVKDMGSAKDSIQAGINNAVESALQYKTDVATAWGNLQNINLENNSPEAINNYAQKKYTASQEFYQKLIPKDSIIGKGVQLAENVGSDIKSAAGKYFETGKEELQTIGSDLSEAYQMAGNETDAMQIASLVDNPEMVSSKYTDFQKKVGTDIYKFSQDEVKPIVGMAAFVNGRAAALYMPFFIDDVLKSVKEGGIMNTVRDFTYGGLLDQLSQGNLAERFYDKPVSTTYDVAMAALAPVLMAHGGFKMAKRYQDNIRLTAEESKISTTQAAINHAKRTYDLLTDLLDKTRNAMFGRTEKENFKTDDITGGATEYKALSPEEMKGYKAAAEQEAKMGDTSGGGGSDSDFDKWLDGVSTQESGGNYNARNASSGAYGKFQIMPENWEGWKNEAAAAGVDVASGRMSDPKAQEAVARFKLRQYRDKYGDEGALVAWYAGEGNGKRWAEGKPDAIGEGGHYSWDARQNGGRDPSIREYVQSSMNHARESGYGGNYKGGEGVSEYTARDTSAEEARDAADEAATAEKAQTDAEQEAGEAAKTANDNWKRTSDEMLEKALEDDDSYKKIAEADDSGEEFNKKTDELIAQHKTDVEDALKAGLDVPEKVLDEYPDLRFKYTGEKEQVSIPEGQYGSKENPDVVPATPVVNKYRTITKPEVNSLINKFVQTYTGGAMEKGVLGTYAPFQDAIRTRAYGDFDTMAHEIAHAIDMRTHVGGANEELINAANKIWGHLEAFQKYPEQVKRAEGIAEFGRQYLLNSHKASVNFPEFFKNFEDVLSLPRNAKLKADIDNMAQAMRSWYAQSPEARTRGSVQIGVRKDNKTAKETAKSIFNKFKRHFIDANEGIGRIANAYLDAGHKFENAADNPEMLARMANTSSEARAEMANGTEDIYKQRDVDAAIIALNKVYDGKLKYKVNLIQAVKKLNPEELNKKYPDYLKNGNMRNWREALSTYLVAAADVERHDVKYKNPLERTKEALENANEKAAEASKTYNEAKLKMRANQMETKERIKKNIVQAQDEVKNVQKLINENERNITSAKTDSRVMQTKIKGLEEKSTQLNQIYDVLSRRKEEFKEKQSIKIQNKMYKESDVVRLKKELTKANRELEQAKLWADTEESASDAAAGILDSAKETRDTVKRAFDKNASEESRLEGTADAIGKSITTLSHMEDALIKRSESIEKRIEATKTKNGRAKEAQTSFEQNRDALREQLKETTKNLNAVKRTRETLEKRNYYRSGEDVKAVEKARKALTKANAEQRKAVNQYQYAKQNKYAMNVDFKDAETTFKNAPQEVKDAAEIVYKHADNLLSIQEATGMISHELAEVFRQYKYYVPMARDHSETQGMLQAGRTSSGFINVKYVNKRLKEGGSTRTVIDPIESLYRNTIQIIRKGELNRVGQSLGKIADAEGMGNYMIRLPEGTKADEKNGIFTVMVKGHEEAFQTVPEFYDIFKGFNTPSTNVVISFLQPWASALRGGAVGFNPSFMLSNALNDTITAAVYNRKLTPILSTMQGIKDQTSAADLQLRMDYMASGANIGGYVTLDRATIVGKLDKVTGNGVHIGNLNTPEGVQWALNGLRKAVAQYSKAAGMVENAPRIEAFRKARESGKSLTEAGLEAKDVTVDFSRSGDWIRAWNKIDPFLNATIQGGDKFFRQLTTYPITTIANAVKWVALPTIALYAMNYNQDWYRTSPAYMRDNNWLIRVPDTEYTIKLKRPQEIGVIFGSALERALDKMILSDPQAGKRWLDNAANTLLPNLMPTFVQLITGLASNYDTFRSMPIENFADLQHLPQNRYNAYTSELAKRGGEITGLSPKKIDFAIRTLFGGAGTFLAQAPNSLLSDNTLPDKGLSDIPVLSRFVVNTEFSSSTDINDFYSNYTNIKMKHKDGQYTKSVTNLNRYYKNMSKLSKSNRDALADKTKTREQKTKIVVENLAKMRALAKKANKEYPIIDF